MNGENKEKTEEVIENDCKFCGSETHKIDDDVSILNYCYTCGAKYLR